MRFRKRPVVISAWQAKPSGNDFPQHVKSGIRAPADGRRDWQVYDKLHDTWVNFDWYDWIIEGVQGELYPCKPDVFAQTYELVDGHADGDVILPYHLRCEVNEAHAALDRMGAPKTTRVPKRVGEGDQEISLTLSGRIMRLGS